MKRLSAKASERHSEKMKGYRESKLVSEAVKEETKKKLKQAIKDGATNEELKAIAHGSSAYDCEVEPREHRYSVNDVTIEKLQVLMAENPDGLLFFRDELSGLLTTMDKQGHEADRKFFLECWVGLHSYRVGRMGRDDVDIPRACLSIFGTIQPGPIASYLKGSITGKEADGFMPRFQVLVYPDPYPKFAYIDQAPDVGARERAYRVFEAINNLKPADLKCERDEDQDIPFVGFDDEAQRFFASWLTTLENRLKSEPMPVMMDSLLGKHRSLMPSLALLCHLVDLVDDRGIINTLPPISLEAAGRAADWCQYLEGHARRLYQMASDGDPSSAIRLSEKIRESLDPESANPPLPNPFTVREVQRKAWGGLEKNDDIRRAIGMLEDHGWVKVVQLESIGGKGPPPEQVWMNPRPPAKP